MRTYNAMVTDMTDSDIMKRGMAILRENLGIIEAERFYFNIYSAEPFDYTEWRKTQDWYDMPFDEMRKQAEIVCPQKSFGLDD